MSNEVSGGERSGRRGRWMLAAVGLAAVAGVSYVVLDEETEAERFCTTEGRIDPEGGVYRRDPEQDCAWVDDDGNLVPDP